MTFTFKIKLDGSLKPPIWRKVKVDASITFLDLHRIVQGIFNWQMTHLFEFSPEGWGSTPRLQERFENDGDFDEAPFSTPDTWPRGERYDATQIRLSQYFHTPKQKIKYIYDFGDDWRHNIELVEIGEESILNPICLAGKGQAPIEDCGGIGGFYHLLETLSNPKHPEYDQVLEWMGMEKGERWDRNKFVLEAVRERLQMVWGGDRWQRH